MPDGACPPGAAGRAHPPGPVSSVSSSCSAVRAQRPGRLPPSPRPPLPAACWLLFTHTSPPLSPTPRPGSLYGGI